MAKTNTPWVGTLAEYEALETHDPKVTYIITDDVEITDLIKDGEVSEKTTFSSRKILSLLKQALPPMPDDKDRLLHANGEGYEWILADNYRKHTDFLASQAFIGAKSINLTLYASGSVYKMPECGYLVLNKYAEATGEVMSIWNNTNAVLLDIAYSSVPHSIGCLICPVSKGDLIKIQYDFSGETKAFKFIYAKGCE